MSRNPFYFNLPTRPADFAGRHALVAELADSLCSWNGDSFGITAGRRMGKSSLLAALNNALLQRLQQEPVSDLYVVPVALSLKALELKSSADVFGFALHRLREVTSRPRKYPALDVRPLPELDLPPYIATNFVAATLQELQATIGEIVAAAQTLLGDVRIALLIDEMDAAVGFEWTGTLFGNMRSLVYDWEKNDYVRIVLAGSVRYYYEADERGSQLFNAINRESLEPFTVAGVHELIDRAQGLDPEVAKAVVRQAGGHPFILQHILHYLFKRGLGSATVAHVAHEVHRFVHNRSADLDGWWNAIGPDGRRAYCILREQAGWVSIEELTHAANDPAFRPDRGVDALCHHGLALHDGSYQGYRLHGELFRDWSLARHPSLEPARPHAEVQDLFDDADVDLTGAQVGQFHNALIQAFPHEGDLAQMVYIRFEVQLTAVAGGQNLNEIVFNLIQWAHAQGRTGQLIQAAVRARPGNRALRLVAEQLMRPVRSPK